MQYITLICGYGPGISHAVARRFGLAGHRIVLVARNAQRLDSAVAALSAEGIQAQAFVADLSDPRATKRMIHQVRTRLGPIGILHWNAFMDVEGSLMSMAISDLSQSLAVRVVGYVLTLQQCIADLQAHQGSVLVSSGIMALNAAKIDAFASNYAALAIAAAAQHKTTNLLAHSLAPYGIYVGELIINAFVIGTAGAIAKTACIDPVEIAEQFWQLHHTRQVRYRILGDLLPIFEEDRYASSIESFGLCRSAKPDASG